MIINDFKIEEAIKNYCIKPYTLLVLGCGELRWELKLNATHILAIDWADERLSIAKEKAMVLKYDVNYIDKILVQKSFDSVVLFDVLEHFTKDIALDLLQVLENKVRKQIILFVPIEDNSITDTERIKMIDLQNIQKENNTNMGYHLSKWQPEEFDKLGYIGEYSPIFHKDKKWGAVFCVKNL